jgi:tetratricopeptide (TPR) repeat protein
MEALLREASYMADGIERLKAALADRYEIEREIGHGGMGVVYLGREIKHDRSVAIKVLRRDVASAVSIDRFHREIEVEASLAHPHIVPLHDSGEVDGVPYCVMPFVEGETVEDRVLREGPLPIAEALRIARQVADALDYAHERGIVHRDIKPRNILLTSKHAVVTDFGICRAVEIAGGKSLTSSGIVIGTPTYMSPEQGDPDAQTDGRSDVYSLGCVLYEMLIGEPPFTGPSAQVIISRHMSETVPSLRVARPAIPEGVEAIVQKALSKAPVDRYQTGGDFAQDLKAVETEVLPSGSLSSGIRTPGWLAGRDRAPKLRLLATDSRQRIRRWLVGWRRVAAVILLLFLIGTAIAVWRMRWLEPSEAFAFPEPSDYIALPLALQASTAAEDSLAQRVSVDVAHVLAGFADLSVVRPDVVSPLLTRIGVERTALNSAQDGLRVAEAAKANRLVVVSVRIVRDSAVATAARYDVETRSFVDQRSATAEADNFPSLARQLAGQLLDLPPAQLARIGQFPSVRAARQMQDGEHHLNRWELESAELSFRQAVAEDTTYARARLLLAMTLFYQGTRDPERLRGLGSEIRRHASAADRQAAGLGYADSLHVAGFRAFGEGDLEGARQAYRQLTEAGSTDHHAWLMRGIIEDHDSHLVQGEDGGLTPRGSWDEAVRALRRAVEVQPVFYLGYANLHEVYGRMSEFTLGGYCQGFQPPGSPPRPIWAPYGPEGLVFLCIASLDPTRWEVVERDEPAPSRPELREEAERLLSRAADRLRDWLEVAPPDDPQTHLIQVDWLLDQRLSLFRFQPGMADSLAREALVHARMADSVVRDTVPETVLQLGALELAAGQVEEAVRTTQRGLEAWERMRGADQPPPAPAANVALATGRAEDALRLARSAGALLDWWADDPEGEGDLLLAPGSEVQLLQAYGSLGFVDSGTYEALERVRGGWAARGYSPTQQSYLRRYLLDQVVSALVPDSVLLAEWISRLEDPPDLWMGLAAMHEDPEGAARLFSRWWEQQRVERLAPRTAYLGAVLARQVGQDSVALLLLDRTREAVLRVRLLDTGWGLRTRSYLLSARSHVALGNRPAARQHYLEFLRAWESSDPRFRPLLEEARAFLAQDAGGPTRSSPSSLNSDGGG